MISKIKYWLHCRKYPPEHVVKWPDLPVKYLVYFRDNQEDGAYIVFVDYEGDLDWRRDDKAEEFTKNANCDCHLSEVQNEVSVLEPLVKNWPKDVKLSAKRILGEALARVFRCDRDNALKVLRKAKKFIEDKSREVSRYWTLQACTSLGFVAVLLGVAAICFRDYVTGAIGHTPYLLFLAACAGAVGALLSILLRLGKLSFDTTAERRLHYAEGSARIIAGSISGVLVGAMVQLGVLLPVFSKVGLTTTAICMSALIAGASERMVPAIITKLETQDATNQPSDGDPQ